MKTTNSRKASEIIKQFNEGYKYSTIKENRVSLPVYISRYVSSTIKESKVTLELLESGDTTFTLEKVNNTYFLTRTIEDSGIRTVKLTKKDLDFFKDLNNIRMYELENLIYELDIKKQRFGL